MSAPTKFLFDVDFAGGGDGKPGDAVIALAEHALRLAEAETAAYRRGHAEAAAESERRIAVALESIATGITAANTRLRAVEARLESEAVEVAVAVARKLAPALLAREPFAEIAELASECFRQLVASPHVAVRVNDALYALARERLEEIARARNFDGRLVVLAEPDIAVGDCRIEWADGGISRNTAATEAAIGDAVSRYLGGRRNSAAAQDETGHSEGTQS